AATGITDPESFKRELATDAVNRYLIERLRGLPQANSIALIGADGVIVNFTHTWPIPRIEAADRDFFVYLRDHNDPKPFVGVPVVNRFTKAWTIMLARRLNGPHGEFLGVIAGVIETQYFEDFYAAVTQTRGASVTLMRTDGTILARYPHVED